MGQLDPAEVRDHALTYTRDYGINKHSFYFGRSSEFKRGDQQEIDEGFVYTSSTLRLMEQICVGIGAKEPLLLVGETGTGKTTSVQELAKLQGKKLHVFNMNQNTDSSDLLGGFKPVEVKYLLKPVDFHPAILAGEEQGILGSHQQVLQ